MLVHGERELRRLRLASKAAEGYPPGMDTSNPGGSSHRTSLWLDHGRQLHLGEVLAMVRMAQQFEAAGHPVAPDRLLRLVDVLERAR